MKYLLTVIIPTLTTLLLPRITLAQDFKGIVGSFTDFLLNLIVPILSSLALLMFFWGAAQYVFQSGSGEEVKESKKRMMWGIVGLFVITAVWGIVSIISGSLGIT